jgi:hypothetical protein
MAPPLRSLSLAAVLVLLLLTSRLVARVLLCSVSRLAVCAEDTCPNIQMASVGSWSHQLHVNNAPVVQDTFTVQFWAWPSTYAQPDCGAGSSFYGGQLPAMGMTFFHACVLSFCTRASVLRCVLTVVLRRRRDANFEHS